MKEFKSKNHELHYRMWDWLYMNPDKHKADWPEWSFRGGEHRAIAECFACEEAGRDEYNLINCAKCPLDWSQASCLSSRSLYQKWHAKRYGDVKERAALAKQIRDMEWEIR